MVSLAVVTVASVFGMATASPATGADQTPPAIWLTASGYYSVPYGPALYYFGDFWYPQLPPYAVSYEAWAASGFEAPRPAPTRYVKVPWASTIYAVHEIPGRTHTGLVVHALTFAEWQAVHFPTPEVTVRVPGAVYTGYSASPEIDVTILGDVHALTLAEWQAAGMPAPEVVGWKPGAVLVRYVTSYPDIFAVVPGGGAHRLSYAEWASWGFPAFESTQAEGYYALTWAPEGIAYVGENLQGRQVSYAEWVAADYPAPRQVPTIDGDRYCLDTANGTVVYTGATWSGTMTYDEAAQRLDLFGAPSC
jgi:hypothetical protein